jgi:hypothetical protein
LEAKLAKNAASIVLNKLPGLLASMGKLSKQELLVGVPKEKTARTDEKVSMNNATLAYIHDNGSPAQNIPARPFMRPGIEAASGQVAQRFKAAAKQAIHGETGGAKSNLNAAGLIAQSSIKAIINAGIAPALSDATLRARIRNKTAVKGAKMELASRAAGNAPGISDAKPLVATAQMRNSISYILREK